MGRRTTILALLLVGCGGGHAPEVRFLAPVGGTTVDGSDAVRFAAEVVDKEEDDLSDILLSWEGAGSSSAPSRADGAGKIEFLAERLPGGEQTLTLTAIDTSGLVGEATVSFTVANADQDGDGVTAETDCDDKDETIFPGADEICDGIDQDCDKEIDEGVLLTWYVDGDGDGFGEDATATEACEAPKGTVDQGLDCDDDLADVNPDGVEICGDGVDQDCSGAPDDAIACLPMLLPESGWTVERVLTVGEAFGGYQPPGRIGGLAAFELDANIVRVVASHDLAPSEGYAYDVDDGSSGTFPLTGARLSYVDLDKTTHAVVAAGPAYDAIYDPDLARVADAGFLADGLPGFARFGPLSLVEPDAFGTGEGIDERTVLLGEALDWSVDPVGGRVWALDVASGALWPVSYLRRGAYSGVAQVGYVGAVPDSVAFLLADATPPVDIDTDGTDEGAPLFAAVGAKTAGTFAERNGLAQGELYAFVNDVEGYGSALDFDGTGSAMTGQFVLVDLPRDPKLASEDGSTGYDEYGFPTQAAVWAAAEASGAFAFSGVRDLAVNPADPLQAVFVTGGVADWAVDPKTGDGADTFGTVYRITLSSTPLEATIDILYDGDADPGRALRAPGGVTWSEDGRIYVQEDESAEASLSGEVVFGPSAANPAEAGVVSLDPVTGTVERLATVDRSVLVDPTTAGAPVDANAALPGEWESSGIVDVSTLFGEAAGTLFVASVQAHGLDDQGSVNADSQLVDSDLVEGGQLVLLRRSGP